MRAVPMGSTSGGQSEVWRSGVAKLLGRGCGVGPGLPPHVAACNLEESSAQNEGTSCVVIDFK